MNTIDTNPGTWYCFFCTAPATVTAEIDGEYVTLAVLDSEGKESFCAPAESISIETDGKFRVLPTKASAGTSGGGYFHSNLNVGHDASAAVAAVCTLTLGDPATGGTLADSNGQSVELENPHKYAEGSVAFRDVTEACTLTIGEWSKEWEAQPRRDANMILTPLESYDGEETPYKFSVTNEYKTCEFEWYAPAGSAVQDLKVAINDEDGTPHWSDGPPLVVASINDEGKLVLTANAFGAQGNGIKVTPSDNTPFELSEEVEFTNGQDARTAVDVFNDIHEDQDCPVGVSLDADEQGLGFVAKEYGVNDAISAVGDMFANWSGMSGGHGDYSVAELVTAIAGEFEDITPAAGEAAGTITLTANTPGAAANAITYTASGCFGGGTVKQGSTTRGKNAVEQTAFKIYLNGEEFTGGGSITVDPVPTQGSPNAVSSDGVYTALRELPAPVPVPLGDDTAMKNGGVYTVAAAGTALDYSDVTLADDYASAEIWVTCTATTTVTWPVLWSWVDGVVPPCAAGNRYFVRVWSDGVAVIAKLEYSYTNV